MRWSWLYLEFIICLYRYKILRLIVCFVCLCFLWINWKDTEKIVRPMILLVVCRISEEEGFARVLRSHVSSDRLTDRRTEDMVRNGYESDRSDVLNLNSSDIRTNIKDTTGSYCTWYYCMNVESSVVLTLNSLFERTKYATPRMRRQRTEEAPLILTSLDSNQARNVLNQTEQWCAASRHGPGHSCAVLVQLKHLGF